MKSYLQNMNRWLCGRCYYTAARRTKNCRRCGDSIETGVSGEAPARPTFRWPTPEGEPSAEAASGEEAMITEHQEPLSMPNLDHVFAICGPMLKYVPSACRYLWAEILTQELNGAESHNNTIAWTRLFMLAKCVLWQPRRTRGGRNRHRKQRVPTIVKERLERWEKGDILNLWDEYVNTCQEHPLQRPADPDTASIRRARRLAPEGRYARACQILTSLGVHTVTEEIWDKL